MTQLQRTRTSRIDRVEAAAAYLSDQCQENWQRDDGRWFMVPQLDPGPASWGIKPLPIYQTGEQLIVEAKRWGWEG